MLEYRYGRNRNRSRTPFKRYVVRKSGGSAERRVTFFHAGQYCSCAIQIIFIYCRCCTRKHTLREGIETKKKREDHASTLEHFFNHTHTHTSSRAASSPHADPSCDCVVS